MDQFLARRTIGFVTAQDGIDELELTGPRGAADAAGARTLLIAPRRGQVHTMRDGERAGSHEVDLTLAACASRELDALILPDGAGNSAALQADSDVGELVSAFARTGRPLGAFGHAVRSLLDAGLLNGLHVTSHPALRRDIERAGGRWHDRRVVVDRNVVTSRAACDVEAFNVQLLALLDR